jgi:hypothetical protein
MTVFGRFTRKHKQCDSNQRVELARSEIKSDVDKAIKKAMSKNREKL